MEMVNGAPGAIDLNARIIRNVRWTPSGESARTPISLGAASATNSYASPSGATAVAMFVATGTGTRNTTLTAEQEMVAAVNGSGTGQSLLTSWPFEPLLKPILGGGGDDTLTQLYRHIFRVGRSVAGTPAADFFGIYFHPYVTTSPVSPGTTGCGYGIVGDSAGGWKFIARKSTGGLLTVDLSIVWPTAVTRMVNVEFRILPPTTTAGAVLEVLVGGATIFSENWDVGRLPYIGDLATAGQYGWTIRNQNLAYPDLYVSRICDMIYAAARL